MSYHTSYAFTAPPDVVFAALADLDLLGGWLADELAIVRQPDDTVTIGWDGQACIRYQIMVCPGEMRLYWSPVAGGTAWSGQAVVCALPVAGSVIQVKLALPGAHRTSVTQVDRIMSHVLRRLDKEAIRRGEAATTPTTELPDAA